MVAAETLTTGEPLLSRLARTMVRRRRWVLLIWVVVLAVAVVGGPKVAGDWSVDYATPGSDSKTVSETIASDFPKLSAETMLVTWQAPAGAKAPATLAHVKAELAKVSAIEDLRPADLARAQYSPDGKTGFVTVGLDALPAVVAVESGPKLLATANAASTDDVTVHFGGMVIQEAERGSVSSEGVGLLFALLILLATFGSIVAAGLPIATALFGIGTGAAVVTGLANFVDTPDWAESVAAMVGLGVGIDYALLVLTRHRATLRAGMPVEDSIAAALATAGRSVVIAGGTVVISMLGLLLMGLPYLNGVAFSASATVLIVMIASLTLLPALLGFAGVKIDALPVPLPGQKRRKQRAAAAAAGTTRDADLPADASPGFARWSRGVQRRPWTAVIAGLAVIALLTAPLAGVRLGYPGPGDEPVGSQARSTHDLLSQAFGVGVSSPMMVMAPAGDAAAQAKVAALRTKIEGLRDVAAVSAPIPSADGKTVLLNVQSTGSADDPLSDDLLGQLRDDVIPASGTRAKVGGNTAEIHDQSYATASRLPLLFVGVAGLSALLLLAAFRSVLIPIKAAAMNLLSIAAAYGVVALVAEGGFFGQLIGITGEVPIPPFIPVLMFAILFGLSMDYEVFLLGRMRELWLRDGDAGRAVTEGLAATARVITAAAAIMIAVFGAFTLSDQVFLKLMGIGMASAVLIDATVIRLLLVPALMGLMGKAAWWMPGWLDRLVPEAALEAPEPESAPAPKQPELVS